MRGVYTCGVLDYFMDKGIKFPDIYAVSAGSGHSMSYVSGQRGRAVRVGTEYLNDWRYCSKKSLLLTGNMFGKKFIYKTIPEKLDHFDFEDYKNSQMKLTCVVTDVETGKAEYIPVPDAKNDMKYIVASSSLPLISRIQRTPQGKFLDGGCADSIPIAHALENSEKAVVVLTQPEGFVKKPSSSQKYIDFFYKRYPKFCDACRTRHEKYNASLELIEKEIKSGRVFCIRPSKALGVERMEMNKDRLLELYSLGYADAEASGIEAFLENNR